MPDWARSPSFHGERAFFCNIRPVQGFKGFKGFKGFRGFSGFKRFTGSWVLISTPWRGPFMRRSGSPEILD